MEETIGGAIVEGALFDVLAENADTLLVASSKEICTGVMMRVVQCACVGLLVLS